MIFKFCIRSVVRYYKYNNENLFFITFGTI